MPKIEGMTKPAIVQAVFTGQPKSITDERGTWTSSIFRDRVDGPVQVSLRGLAGDRVAQPYHGSPGAAICAHLTDHYSFWNAEYKMNLQAGSVGENVTLDHVAEDQVCVGDRVRLGTAVVQVSGPRVPCANQARRIGRPDWVKLTIRENRTGFYLRVLEPGTLQAGDPWIVEERVNQDGSIPAINRCMYLEFDASYARKMLEMPGLEAWWKDQARQKIDDQTGHWTSTMKNGGD
jgi:MOSC domain-containing protein YiiM